MKEIVLGAEQQFQKLPVEVEVEQRPCFLLKDRDVYRLVSRKCPHAGQLVDIEDEELVCPMHGWSFDPHKGACLNVPARSLAAYSVVVRDGMLIAQVDG
ncbi:Rieske (2Fe-2S) protein [Paenibacillus validus]|uniref:Rieske 2Fe-2S domain-containing protein n=1 Tax=Paenibacillus validus TaxID=44253 RepID=A0A7X3CUG1_9BACL|nr:Rieske (2Fe-2S) protein [Paenibacillus validus]MED4604106.1 Rieske (2Fe-2S) protein [Paenibacillus validus]MED4609705.1 Rieske (2Fe-2S) protein [Paenibacillus validus]MUG72069.1 Rieske 2Fe-2S domain-containing protein [Paenibacillus validus]